MDSQTVEIIGRNYLVSQLVSAGLEVARPERDRGVDLIAYVDLDEAGGGFVACPIQMKAATKASFAVDRKYEKFTKLLFAYVWRAATPDHASVYTLTYREALGVAEAMGWTATASWQEGGIYSTTRPSARLVGPLEPYLTGPDDWKTKIRQVGSS